MANATVWARAGGSNRCPERVLVWGALGFIGSHLTEALLARGYDVAVLCRSRSAYASPRWACKVSWYELSSGNHDEVMLEALRGVSIVFNLAGSSGAVASNADPLRSMQDNCGAQLRFLQACRTAGTRPHVVFTSSRLVYGETMQTVVSEDLQPQPRSIYAVHKVCCEQYLQVYATMGAITHTICRISNAYGPDPGRAGQGYKILNSFIQKCLAHTPVLLFGSGEQVRDFVFVDDLTDVMVQCGTLPSAVNEIFNIGCGKGCRLVDAARMIRELTDAPPLVFQPWPEEYLTVESGDYISDISKARRLLGFEPQYDIARGIHETICAYQEEVQAGMAAPVLPSGMGLQQALLTHQ